MTFEPLNLFYEEPDPDRWFPGDRYPRRLVRRILRGKPRISGQRRVFLNLCAGLEKIGIPYRSNDYRYIVRHEKEIVCILGKPHLLDRILWKNPILFGACVYSHPTDDPNLLSRLPIKKILVPGEWMRRMCEPFWGEKVWAWPVGIDTQRWAPLDKTSKDTDILLYDKIRWEHERYESEFILPIRRILERKGLKITTLRYGFYEEEDFHHCLQRTKAMLFLCEHETQGIAYQQALSSGVPILAWDRGGFWQDPEYFPHRVKFAPVSPVPYWDERCGLKFKDLEEFATVLEQFLDHLQREKFSPRDYILENLTLEKCAQDYAKIFEEVKNMVVLQK